MVTESKVKKATHLKHFLGCPAMAFSEHHAATGELESIDFEESMACIKTGNESHWFDLSIVEPNLKTFKQLTIDDVMLIVTNASFDGRKINQYEVTGILIKESDVFVQLVGDSTVHINDMFWIHKDKTPVDNIGEIILLLCDMGFDVRSKA